MSRQKKGMVVILGNFQGRKPIVISEEDGEPKAFPSVDAAHEFTCTQHMGLMACETIVIVDLMTGEPDTNAHEIGWAFVDRDAPQDLTEEEEQSVYDQLAQIEPERFPDDVI